MYHYVISVYEHRSGDFNRRAISLLRTANNRKRINTIIGFESLPEVRNWLVESNIPHHYTCRPVTVDQICIPELKAMAKDIARDTDELPEISLVVHHERDAVMLRMMFPSWIPHYETPNDETTW
jgi:hypothetical protein